MPYDQHDHEIIYDTKYAEELSQKLQARFGSSGPRNATHVSDLFFCLRKAWGKQRIPVEEQEEANDEKLLTWAGGLQFEDLVSEGEKQGAMAYCYTCQSVSRPAAPLPGKGEIANCPVCNARWLVGTPDYIVD